VPAERVSGGVLLGGGAVRTDGVIPQPNGIACVLGVFGVQVVKAGSLEEPELPDGFVHVLWVEHANSSERVEVLQRQARYPLEQLRVQRFDDIYEGFFPEVCQVHEHGHSLNEFEEFAAQRLDLFPFGFPCGFRCFVLFGGTVLGLGCLARPHLLGRGDYLVGVFTQAAEVFHLLQPGNQVRVSQKRRKH